MIESTNGKPAGQSKALNAFHTAIMVFCAAGTVCLIVFVVMFAKYYSASSDRLVAADMRFGSHGKLSGKQTVRVAFKTAETMGKSFEWGGCRPEKLDLMEGTFYLHCWGLEKSRGSFDRASNSLGDISKDAKLLFNGRKKLSGQDKAISLLAAFCYEKLHFGTNLKPGNQQP